MQHDALCTPWLVLLTTISCALAAVACPAAAQQSVVVTGKADDYDARRDDTTARLVVGRAELDRYGDSNLADVLRRQPGITVGSAMPGQASAGEIRMRGLGQGYTQVLVDGKPAPAGFSIDSLAPAQLERIEIIRSVTVDMSGQAIAGTINLVLRLRAHTRAPASAGGSFNLRSGGRLALSPSTSTYKTVQRNLDLYGLWRLAKGDSLRVSVNNLLAQPATASSIYDDGAGRRESRSVYPFSPIGRVVWEHRY